MNRQQRRNFENKYKTNPLIEKVRQQGIEQGRQQSLELILTMVAYTIDYKLELPSDKLCKLMISILDNIDAYRTGHLTSEDFITIKKELNEKGIIIKEKT